VAALRMNLPARYFYVPNGDGFEGLAVVVSKGNGFTLTMKVNNLTTGLSSLDGKPTPTGRSEARLNMEF